MWTEYDRAAIRGAIEERTGRALPVDDPLPEDLIAEGQAAGASPIVLQIWIAAGDEREDWSAPAFGGFLRTETVRGAIAAMAQVGA